MNRNGLTIMEVMIAVALASFIAAIGFTGIVAFGRSITRAKQFVSETEIITAAIRMGIASADNNVTPSYAIDPAPGAMAVPKNWIQCTITTNGTGTSAKSLLTFLIPDSKQLNKSTTGDVRGALNMTKDDVAGTGTNTLQLRILPSLP